MKSAAATSLFNVASSVTNAYHTLLIADQDSWCLFKTDKANNTSTYKPGPGLPLDIIKVVKPIYQGLCSQTLLKKCTHSQIQFETFNGMIWNSVPKHTYVGQQNFETGVFDAVAHFKIGTLQLLRIFKSLGTQP